MSDLGEELTPFFALSLDLLCLANTDGYFIKVNPAFVVTLGWSEQTLLSQRFLDFVHPADVDSTLAEIARLAAGERTIDFENRYRCADGSWRWLDWRAAPQPETGIIYAVARDVTQLKRARESAERARREAEGANHSKSEFLANMSHELRTPLNSIIGYSEMLLEDLREGLVPEIQQMASDLERVRGAGLHLLQLINQVLDLSKIEAGHMDVAAESFSVPSLVSEVQAMVQPQMARNNNQLRVSLGPEVSALNSDLTKVRQILFNLLSNAAKFTRDGEINLRVTEEDGAMRFEVTDTGVGVEPEEIERLFEPFTQADASTTRRYGGTGLGLNISRRFCALLGGQIDMTSQPGRGTRVWFTLPLTRASAGAAQPVRAAPQPVDVLVIDDDPDARELVSRILRQQGYSPAEASGGREGLALAEASQPQLIVLDLMMPEMDGWEVLTRLRASPSLSQIPVVLTTVLTQDEIAFTMGIAGALTKPVRGEHLAELLQRHDIRPDIPTALIVEDDESSREMLERLLRQAGWRTRAAATGDEGLAVLAELERPPDAVLLDLTLPGMDGFDFAERLRGQEETREVPVIVITARDMNEGDHERLRGSVQRVLSKGGSLGERLRAELTRLEDRR